MKTSLHVLAALCLSTVVQTAHTADVDNYLVAKGQEFRQTNSASPVQIPAEEPFRAFTSVMPTAPGLITNATLRLPSAVVVNLETNDDGSFEAEASFTNKSQLDAQVKSGTYTFNIFTLNSGTNKPTLTLPADAYPTTPLVLNWLDAQEVDHHLDFSLQWAPFTNGTANDFIVFSISNTNDEDVVSTPGILETNALTGTNTSAVVAAGNLQASTTYQGRLLFVKRTSTNTNGIPGALGIAGYYKQTIFPLVTLPEDTGAGRIEIGARNFSVSEADPGELLVPIYRSSASLTGEVSVTLTIADGTAQHDLDFDVNNLVSVITFSNGVGYAGISVRSIDDFLFEGNETLTFSLSNPTGGATLGSRSNAIVTILDNETAAAGRLQFSPVIYNVTEAGKQALLTVTRTGGTVGNASIAYETHNGSAIGGLDFTPTNGVLNFAPGQASRQIIVPIINDTLDETNENFTVSLNTTTGGAYLGSNLVATVTITDDDTAGTVQFKSAAFSTNEFAPAAVVTVVRSGGLAGNVTVYCDTQNGTTNGATSGVDYSSTQVVVTFNSNELTKTFSIPLINDFEVETNETIFLRMIDPTGGARIGAISNAIVTILDDESNISFTNVAYTATETGLKATINLVRNGARITSVAVSYSTVDGTATSTNDYRGTNNSVVFFPPNVGFKTITIPIVNDTIVDSNETFSVFLHSPTGGVTLGTITNTTVTIKEDDAGGVISFTVTNFSITEVGPAAKILLARTGGKAGAVTVNLSSADGTATAGLDYTSINTNVTFNAGELAKTILVPVANDSLDETNETVLLALSNPTGGASIGSKSNAVLTILDDDVGGTLSLSSATYTTNENGGAFIVTVNRTIGKASAAGVSFSTFDGTALGGEDYGATDGILTFGSNEVSKVITIGITNDTVAEGNEAFSFRIFNPTGGAILGANTNATLTIRDDESSVSFTNASYSVGESGPVVNVNVVREGALITQVGVAFSTADGEATSTNDYRGTNGFIVFPPNVGFKTITIPIANDTIVEGNETFSIFLHSPTGGVQFATGLGHFTNTVVTITNNDSGGIINFKATAFSTNESNNAIITITRTNGVASGVSVTFSAEGGSASSPSDYAAGSQTVTFAANQTSTNVVVTIINDTLDETNETVNLFLGNVQGGGTLGVVSNAVLTILDNDSGGTIQFSSLSYATNEGAGIILATVIRTNGLASGVTVDFLTQNGTASAESDYTNTTGTLTFNAGETNKTVTVGIIDDILPDGNKNFSLSLTNPTGGAVLGVRSNATMNITDDENSVVIESASYTTNEAAGAIAIKVVRSGVLTSAVSVQFSTANDSAVSPGDYIGTNRTLNFPAGSGLQTVIIPIVNDTIDESDETFTVALSNPQNGVQIGSTSNAVVTITDNDTAGSIQFSGTSYNVTEATNNAAIRITRTGGLASGVTVQFKTTTGTATPVADYTAATNTVTFNAGESNKIVLVPIVADGVTESNETVNVVLSLPTGSATLGAPAEAVLTISDAPDVDAVPLAGSPFFNATITGTNLTFNRTLNITTWGGTSSGLNTSMFTNAPASNIVTMVAQKSANSLVNGTQLKVVRDNITFNVFQILGLGPRPFGTPPLGTVIYQFEDTINGVGTLYVAQWESGLVKIDGMSFNGNGDLTGVSGRMDIIVKADTNERFRIVGSFRTKP
ncbi:MAG: hypothetical protein HOP33_23685 [Verrucomicrobia bacterium]|nr:hypothetical protein [Verrucomicrobiota bacterium]